MTLYIKRMTIRSLSLAVGFVLPGMSMAEVSLPALFANDMVIQRNTQAPVWGWADPGEQVTVTASWGGEARATADQNGRWEVRLATPEAGGPHTLTLEGTNTLTLENVLSGDVWICSGQSNMEWPLSRTTGAMEEIASAETPGIRLFQMHKQFGPEVLETYKGDWRICSPKTAGSFTAVGYYFGKEIHLDQKIPIGLLSISWGGTRIEAWTAPVGFRQVPELSEFVEEQERMDPTTDRGNMAYLKYVSELETWIPQAKRQLAHRQELSPIPEAPQWRYSGNNQDSSFIFNGMIAPILPLAVKGVIWYQGESNGGESREVYRAKMKGLIGGWRSVFDQGEFPFYFVQLANLNTSDPNNPEAGKGYARVRQAQFDSLGIPHTGMAVAIDVGESKDIHPRNKRDVGKRLSRWALARDYGKVLVPSGPLYKQMTVDGNRAVLSFDYVGGGLMVGKKEGMAPAVEDPNAKLKWFAIQGQDNRWRWGDAVITGDTVEVSSPEVSVPKAVRYAYAFNPEGCNLYNREGLPASPFTTEE